MGLIAKIIDSFTGSDGEPSAKVEVYKDDNATARVFNPPGVDARPLDGDACYIEDSQDTEGGKDVLGFINEPVSGKGEIRIVSRDSSGNAKASIYVKSDGSIEINAPAGLKITANTEITGTLTVSGIIKSLVDIIADYAGTAITMLTHFHLGNLGYNTAVPTAGAGVPKPGNAPTYDSGDSTVDFKTTGIKNVGTMSENVEAHTHSQGSDSGGDSEVDTNGPN